MRKHPETPDLFSLYKNDDRKTRLNKDEELEFAHRIEALSKIIEAIDELSLPLSLKQQTILTQSLNERRRLRNRLCQSNLGQVVSIAKQHQGRGVPFLDLIQEGNLGLLEAVGNYDPKRETKVNTYAHKWILKRVLAAIKDKRTIRIPEELLDLLPHILKIESELITSLDCQPTDQEIADALNSWLQKKAQTEGKMQDKVYEAREVRKLLTLANNQPTLDDESVDLEIFPTFDENYRTLRPVEEEIFNEIEAQKILRYYEAVLRSSTFSSEDKKILELYYGLNGEEPCPDLEIQKRVKQEEQPFKNRLQILKRSFLLLAKKNRQLLESEM